MTEGSNSTPPGAAHPDRPLQIEDSPSGSVRELQSEAGIDGVNWRSVAEKDIANLLLLPTGWDGHRTAPPNQTAVALANVVLVYLVASGLKPDRIAASGDEGVALSFYQDDKYACIECFNTGEIVVATMDDANKAKAWDVSRSKEMLLDMTRRINDFLNSRSAGGNVPQGSSGSTV